MPNLLPFMELLFILSLFLALGEPLKFLAYNPQFAAGHVRFIGKCADALIDAGHEVVILSQKVDSYIHDAGSKKARVIEIPQTEQAKILDSVNERIVRNVWQSPSAFTLLREIEKMLGAWISITNETLYRPNLIEELRAEKFDGAFSEAMDYFPFGLYHLLGIDRFAITQSFAIIDGRYDITHAQSNPAYVPAQMGNYGEEMTFTERLMNTVMFMVMSSFGGAQSPHYQKMFEDFSPGFPPIEEVIRNNSLVFLNSDPLLDFPRPTTHRIIDIGGLTVSTAKPEPLNEEWSEIFTRRQHTILLSFGTFVKAFMMPEEYKVTIRETMKKFPNVTFIWKYEKPDHNVSGGVENIVETKWMPQVDLLNDPRLTAFITHGGQGSITEASGAGVPLVCIPVATDQLRNSQLVKRNKLGVVLAKEDLSDGEKLEAAIREVLENPIYRESARKKAEMLRNRPFNVRETFVKNMEFMVEFGPLRMLDHYGTKLSFVQFYLIDVIAFLTALAVGAITVIILIIWGAVRCIKKRCGKSVYAEVASTEPKAEIE